MEKIYEAIFIIKEIEDEKKVDEVIKKINNVILAEKAEFTKKEKMGLKRLAYEIRGQKKGYYYLVNFKTIDENGKNTGKISAKINTIEEVIKYIIIRMDDEK